MNAFIAIEKVLALVSMGLKVDLLVAEVQQYKRSVDGDPEKLSEFIDSLLDQEISATQRLIDEAREVRERA